MTEEKKNQDNDVNLEVQETQPATVTAEQNELQALREEKEKYYNNWLRSEAELDNFKKRVMKEKEEFKKFALEGIIKDILTPIDYLEMAIAHTKESKNIDALIQGVEYTIKCMLDILKSYGVEQIYGKDIFDPNFYEASSVEERDDLPEGTVIKELRKAYTMQGRLLRAGMVIVSKKTEPQKEEAKEELNSEQNKEE